MWKQKEENKITICRFALKSWHSDRNLGTSDGYHHRWLLFGAFLIHSHVGLENLHKVWTKSGPVQSKHQHLPAPKMAILSIFVRFFHIFPVV